MQQYFLHKGHQSPTEMKDLGRSTEKLCPEGLNFKVNPDIILTSCLLIQVIFLMIDKLLHVTFTYDGGYQLLPKANNGAIHRKSLHEK